VAARRSDDAARRIDDAARQSDLELPRSWPALPLSAGILHPSFPPAAVQSCNHTSRSCQFHTGMCSVTNGTKWITIEDTTISQSSFFTLKLYKKFR
jgi:hypothetical protein